MMTAQRTLSCVQVSDISEAKKHYQQELGCTVRREHGECATLDCRGDILYVCESPEEQSLSKSAHDELDEAADAYW